MIAAHHDQENLINGQQTAAASKPLNQGIKELAPKTPGNNGLRGTKIPLNTEKKASGRRSLRKNERDYENAPPADTGKGERLPFTTPIAPRTRDRAPLGVKTTNAKTTAFQTPAPLTQRTQRQSTSTRKHKLKVHRPVALEVENPSLEPDEEPEIEYCPPKITPLPDHPDEEGDWGLDKKFHMFEEDNMFLRWHDRYSGMTGDDGLSGWERESQERDSRIEKMQDDEVNTAVQMSLSSFPSIAEELGELKVERRTSELRQTKESSNSVSKKTQPLFELTGPSTLRSNEAAAALSERRRPNFARATATSKARRASVIYNSPRQTKGSIVSRTTIGYAQGRKMPSPFRNASGTTARPGALPEEIKVQPNAEEEDLRALMQKASKDDDPDTTTFNNAEAAYSFFHQEAENDFVLELP